MEWSDQTQAGLRRDDAMTRTTLSARLAARKPPARLAATALAALALSPGLGFGKAQAGVEYDVGAGGTHQSIQSAVMACPAEGCIINLADSVYALPREIWIEGKSNLTLRAAPALQALGIKPRLHYAGTISEFLQPGTAADPTDPQRPAGWKKWPSSCQSAPGGSRDTSNPHSTVGFQNNGLIVVKTSRDIRIEGLHLDGKAPQYFVNKGVWNCMYDVLFGNVGINVHRSKHVVVAANEIRNFFSAIYINGRNLAGAARADLLAAEELLELQKAGIAPYSRHGEMGDHLVERNFLHDNWWAVYDHAEYDLGSTFRFNIALDNRNTRFSQSTDSSSEGNNMAGGFMYTFDVPQTIHRIHNNTIWGSPLVLGHGGFRVGAQHFLYNNIVGGFDRIKDGRLAAMIRDWRQVLNIYDGVQIENNLFEVGAADSMYQAQTFTSGQIEDTTLCATLGQNAPCWATFDAPVRVATGIKNYWLWNGWNVAQGAAYSASVKSIPVRIRSNQAIEQFPGGGVIAKMTGLGSLANSKDVSSSRNLWVKSIPWKSTTPGAAGFMEPDWGDSVVAHAILGQGRAASGWFKAQQGTPPDIGAIQSEPVPATIFALHSQEPVTTQAGSCFSIPLRLQAGPTFSSLRLAKAQAWSVPLSSATEWKPRGPQVEIPVKPLDSSVTNGTPVVACLATAPPESNGLVFRVELQGTLSGVQTIAASEPAYYWMGSPLANYTTGLRTAERVAARPLSLALRGGALQVRGVPAGECRVRLLSLDGRTLWQGALSARKDGLRIPAGQLASGTVLVQVEQGAQSWQAVAPLLR